VVVPFFGDQAFWGEEAYCSWGPALNMCYFVGSMIHKTGAGPKPIPHKELRVENLRDAINFATSANAATAAATIAESIRNEVGVFSDRVSGSALITNFRMERGREWIHFINTCRC
jgi:hypothetical protein